VGGVIVVCYGLAQLMFTGLPAINGKGARFGNDLLGPNNQAAALLLPIAIATARSLVGSVRSRLVHALATVQLLFGIMMTGSRGGLLATVVVLATVLLVSAGRRATKVQLVGAAVVLLVFVLAVNPGGVGRRQVEKTDSAGRSDIWNVALHACQYYCATGAGWGGFPTVYKEQQPSVPEANVLTRGKTLQPHNIFILSAIEAGVLGMVLVIAGLGLALLTALRLPRAMRAPPLAGLVGTFVSSFFLSNLEYKFFWIVLAYVTVSGQVAALGRGDPTSVEGAAVRRPLVEERT
jgi:O-antigen ligase